MHLKAGTRPAMGPARPPDHAEEPGFTSGRTCHVSESKCKHRSCDKRTGALQPQLPYRNLDDILRKVSAQFFRRAFDDVTWCFVVQRTLACITPASRLIQIHNVLNATDVPEHVFVTILIHEMLHLQIPPTRTENGRSNMHPPEFWDAESRLSPAYEESWNWLYTNLPLRRRPRLQCTEVVPNVLRLTPKQREWAREQFSIALPPIIRSDDPSYRRITPEIWRIALAARFHR
jgi:hypothetical protein